MLYVFACDEKKKGKKRLLAQVPQVKKKRNMKKMKMMKKIIRPLHLLTPHFIVWFVEWNELIHHHLIPRRLIIRNTASKMSLGQRKSRAAVEDA